MKKLIMLALVAIAVYTLFFNSPFKKEISFNGEVYSHLKEVNLGSIHNHIYTPGGQSVGSSKTFLQIFELDKEVKKNLWKFQLAAIIDKYKLTPIKDRDSEYSGSPIEAGLFFNTFAAPIHVNDNDHLVLFIENNKKERIIVSEGKREVILNELKSLESVFR